MSDKLLSEAKKMSERNFSMTFELDGGIAHRNILAGGMAEAAEKLFKEFEEPPKVLSAIDTTDEAAPSARAAQGEGKDGEIIARIKAYLAGGGLFNPELANHDTVRDLIIDARDYITALQRDLDCGCGISGCQNMKRKCARCIAEENARLTARVEELESIVEAQNDPDSVGNPAWLARRMQERGDAAEAESAQLREQVKGLEKERDEWKYVAHHRLRLVNGIFETLLDWYRRATYLPPGKSGRLWVVAPEDISHLKKWAEGLDDLVRKGPMNAPHQYACEPPERYLASAALSATEREVAR